MIQCYRCLMVYGILWEEKREAFQGGGVILMHLIFCSNKNSEIKCLLFKSVFRFSLKKSNKLQKAFNFLLRLPHKPNLSHLVIILFFPKSRLICFSFSLKEKEERCFNTFSFSNQAFLKEIILPLIH